MAQAIMDPEKVRRFAEELQRFNSDIENRLILLHTRFAALGDTWSDQEHEKFSEEFNSSSSQRSTRRSCCGRRSASRNISTSADA